MSARPWTKRLDYLSALEDGWLDGCGKPSLPEARKATEDILSELFPADEEYVRLRPGLFPMEEGGIVIEWYVANRLISLEVMGESDDTYSLFYMNIENHDAIEFDSNDPDVIVRKLKETVLFSSFIPVTSDIRS